MNKQDKEKIDEIGNLTPINWVSDEDLCTYKQGLRRGALEMAQWKEEECKRRVSAMQKVAYQHGLDDGKDEVIEKACEWLKENIYHRVYECGDRLGFPTAEFIEDFKQAMEDDDM